MKRIIAGAAALLALAACGTTKDETQIGQYYADFDEAAVSAEQALAAHETAAKAAADLPAMQALEGDHHAAMGEWLDGMDHAREAMAMCAEESGLMEGHQMEPMATGAATAHEEMDRHHGNMTAAADRAAAEAEEARHQEAMRQAVAEMRRHRQEMGALGEEVACGSMDDEAHGH